MPPPSSTTSGLRSPTCNDLMNIVAFRCSRSGEQHYTVKPKLRRNSPAPPSRADDFHLPSNGHRRGHQSAFSAHAHHPPEKSLTADIKGKRSFAFARSTLHLAAVVFSATKMAASSPSFDRRGRNVLEWRNLIHQILVMDQIAIRRTGSLHNAANQETTTRTLHIFRFQFSCDSTSPES